jgi:hypothetical protein
MIRIPSHSMRGIGCAKIGTRLGIEFIAEGGGASSKLLNFRRWFVAAEDCGIARGKLVETSRLPPENRGNDGRNLRLFALPPLGKKLEQCIAIYGGIPLARFVLLASSGVTCT